MLLSFMTISNGLNNLGDYKLPTYLLVMNKDLEIYKTDNLEIPTCFPIINTVVSIMVIKNTSKLRSKLIPKHKTFLNRIKSFNLSNGTAVPRRVLNQLSEGKANTFEDTEDTVD